MPDGPEDARGGPTAPAAHVAARLAAQLEPLVRATFESHWREPGYTCPNGDVYPWQWLWDSCFHAVVWAELGDTERALTELVTVFAGQDPETGFVPHVGYHGDPELLEGFWGRRGFSSITQPPLYGWALSELVRMGADAPSSLVDRVRAGLDFLLEWRARTVEGLVTLVHPWESGADDSPRWDALLAGPWNRARWRAFKGELLDTVTRSRFGAPLANPACGVASVAFNALIAHDALALAEVDAAQASEGCRGSAARLREASGGLVEALAGRWDPATATWIDAGPTEGTSGGARTLEGLLPLLVERDPGRRAAVAGSLTDPAVHGGGRFGPVGVARCEPTFEPGSYWRGPTWPQLDFLLWTSLRCDPDAGRRALADELVMAVASGALESGLAEYWDSDSGIGGGAAPQSWTALAWVMARRTASDPASPANLGELGQG